MVEKGKGVVKDISNILIILNYRNVIFNVFICINYKFEYGEMIL